MISAFTCLEKGDVDGAQADLERMNGILNAAKDLAVEFGYTERILETSCRGGDPEVEVRMRRVGQAGEHCRKEV